MRIRVRIRIANTSYRCLLPLPFFLFCLAETNQQMRETYFESVIPHCLHAVIKATPMMIG
jgi:hypothetical protein